MIVFLISHQRVESVEICPVSSDAWLTLLEFSAQYCTGLHGNTLDFLDFILCGVDRSSDEIHQLIHCRHGSLVLHGLGQKLHFKKARRINTHAYLRASRQNHEIRHAHKTPLSNLHFYTALQTSVDVENHCYFHELNLLVKRFQAHILFFLLLLLPFFRHGIHFRIWFLPFHIHGPLSRDPPYIYTHTAPKTQ